jgi:hypothetical protein
MSLVVISYTVPDYAYAIGSCYIEPPKPSKEKRFGSLTSDGLRRRHIRDMLFGILKGMTLMAWCGVDARRERNQ